MMEVLMSENAMMVYGAIYIMAEYALGRTDWVKSNSVVEMALAGFVSLYKKMMPKK